MIWEEVKEGSLWPGRKRGALYQKSGRVYQNWTGAVDVSRSRRGGDEKEVSDTLEPGLLIKRKIRLMPRGLKDCSIDSKRTERDPIRR